jgi:hypothetical protein
MERMAHEANDPDLSGDDAFRPSPPSVEVEVDGLAGPRLMLAMTLPAEAQAAIHHNRLRYNELQLLRMGQANDCARTRYRH